MGVCYGCGKISNQLKDCPICVIKGRECTQAPINSPNSYAPKNSRFHDLQTIGDQESSLNVVTVMLQLFSINVYALVDPSGTLCFVNPLVTMIFYMLPDVLYEPFLVSTPVGDSVISKRVFRDCHIALPNRVTFVDLV